MLIVEEEVSSNFQGCALGNWVGLFNNNRLVVTLLNISNNHGIVEGFGWKIRSPILATWNLNNLELSSLHYPVGKRIHGSGGQGRILGYDIRWQLNQNVDYCIQADVRV